MPLGYFFTSGQDVLKVRFSYVFVMLMEAKHTQVCNVYIYIYKHIQHRLLGARASLFGLFVQYKAI